MPQAVVACAPVFLMSRGWYRLVLVAFAMSMSTDKIVSIFTASLAISQG